MEWVAKSATRCQNSNHKRQLKNNINTEGVAKTTLPDFIPSDSWDGFLAMRRSIKKPMTERAIQLAIKKLKQFHDKGYDIGAILDKSTINCWQDIYEPKESSPTSSSQFGAGNIV